MDFGHYIRNQGFILNDPPALEKIPSQASQEELPLTPRCCNVSGKGGITMLNHLK